MHVKICGITNPEDALAAAQAGADLLGFNFYNGSPRCITTETCSQIIHALPGRKPVTVGVFVNAALEEIKRVMAVCGLDLAQLSGDEPPELLTALGGKAYKALRPKDEKGLLADIERYPHCPESSAGYAPPAWLIDACLPGAYGGTGQPADWRLAAALARRAPILLAGGLRAENVAEAIRQVQPWGVDVASGVESRPGYKDHAQMAAFIRRAKTAPGRQDTL